MKTVELINGEECPTLTVQELLFELQKIAADYSSYAVLAAGFDGVLGPVSGVKILDDEVYLRVNE